MTSPLTKDIADRLEQSSEQKKETKITWPSSKVYR